MYRKIILLLIYIVFMNTAINASEGTVSVQGPSSISLERGDLPSVQPHETSHETSLTPQTINLLALYFANFAYYPHTLNSTVWTKRTYWQSLWGSGKPEDSELVVAGPIGGESQYGKNNFTLLKDFILQAMPQKNPDIKKTEGCIIPSKLINEYLSSDYTDLTKWKIELIDGENGINFGIKSTDWTISAVVAYHSDKNILVVATRGTDSSKIRDLITDVAPTGRTVKEAHPFMSAIPEKARVPRGFLGYFESMSDEIIKAVKTLVPNEKEPTVQVIITGHSLGGAAANLVAAAAASMSEVYPLKEKFKDLSLIEDPDDISNFTLHNIHLRTFGMPANVGNQAYVDWIESKVPDIIHFSNPRDPVSNLTSVGRIIPSVITGKYSQGVSKKWVVLKSTDTDTLQNVLGPHGLDRYSQAIIEQDPIYENMRLDLLNKKEGLNKKLAPPLVSPVSSTPITH